MSNLWKHKFQLSKSTALIGFFMLEFLLGKLSWENFSMPFLGSISLYSPAVGKQFLFPPLPPPLDTFPPDSLPEKVGLNASVDFFACLPLPCPALVSFFDFTDGSKIKQPRVKLNAPFLLQRKEYFIATLAYCYTVITMATTDELPAKFSPCS